MENQFDSNKSGIYGRLDSPKAQPFGNLVKYEATVSINDQRLNFVKSMPEGTALYLKTADGNIYKITRDPNGNTMCKNGKTNAVTYFSPNDYNKCIVKGGELTLERGADIESIESIEFSNNPNLSEIEIEFASLRERNILEYYNFNSSREIKLYEVAAKRGELYFKTDSGNIYRVTIDSSGRYVCVNANEGTASYISYNDIGSVFIRVGDKAKIAGFLTTKVREIFCSEDTRGQIIAEFGSKLKEANRKAAPLPSEIVYKNGRYHSRGFVYSKVGQTFTWDFSNSMMEFEINIAPLHKKRRGTSIFIETKSEDYLLCARRHEGKANFYIVNPNGSVKTSWVPSGDELKFTIGEEFVGGSVKLDKIYRIAAVEDMLYQGDIAGPTDSYGVCHVNFSAEMSALGFLKGENSKRFSFRRIGKAILELLPNSKA